jgi:hypothetical protein
MENEKFIIVLTSLVLIIGLVFFLLDKFFAKNLKDTSENLNFLTQILGKK